MTPIEYETIMTLDRSFSDGRDWGSPSIPEKINLKTMLHHAPDALRHPRWLMQFAKVGASPYLSAPNMELPCQDAPSVYNADFEWIQTPPPDWDDITWFAQEWGLPLMVEGIMRIDDAKRCIDVVAASLSVSNHGGNNLDGTPATIRALGPIADCCRPSDRGHHPRRHPTRGRCRQGTNLIGARTVMSGRAGLSGLAASGQTGFENVLDLLRGEIDSAVCAMRPLVDGTELARDDLINPDGRSNSSLGK